MEKIEALEDAIQKENLVGIYSVFYTIAHGDPNFSTGKFMTTLNYVKSKNIEGFLQEFDGEEFEPEDKWNEEYWALIASSLIDNFCDIRIKHLEQVGKKVYPIRNNIPVNKQTNTSEKNIIEGDGERYNYGNNHKSNKRIGGISEENKRIVRENNRLRSEERNKGYGLWENIKNFFVGKNGGN